MFPDGGPSIVYMVHPYPTEETIKVDTGERNHLGYKGESSTEI